MPVVLRKRKAAVEPAPAPLPKRKVSVAKAAAKVKEAPRTSPETSKANGSASAAATAGKPTKVAVDDVITLAGFGGEVETQDGEVTTLQKLVEKSENGVVLFTYPRASTPGCTKQVCLFRDSYTPFSATGFAIYGLSSDSPKANTTFKTKQKLPYDLLCDPKATLIAAIGLKKSPSSTVRGIFIVDKEGKVLAAEPGSPAGTVEVAEKLLNHYAKLPPVSMSKGAAVAEDGADEEDVQKAEVAADVANTAEELDDSTKV